MQPVVCNRKCFKGGRLYLEGERASFADGEIVSKHFTPISSQVVEVKPPIIDENSEPISRLRSELDTMGKAWDGRWGVDKLEMEIQKARKGM